MKTNKLIVFFLFLAGLPFYSYAQDDDEYDIEVDGIYYKYDLNTMEASVCKPPYEVTYTGAISIPATISRGRYTFEVTKVEQGGLSGQNMTSVTFLTEGDKGVKTIEKNGIAFCWYLEEVTLPPTLTDLGESAFCQDVELTTVNIPDGVKELKKNTFSDCKKLQFISLPDSMDAGGIGERCFSKTGLTSITIPKGVRLTKKYAFVDCEDLVSVTLPDDFYGIQTGMFSGCQSLESINFPPSLYAIMYEAFDYCKFTSFTVPPSVQLFVWDAICSCYHIKDLVFEDDPESINIAETEFNSNQLTTVENLYWGRNFEGVEDNQVFKGLKNLTIGKYVTSLPYTFGDNIEKIKCNFEDPSAVSEKFNSKVKANATLIVPKGTYDKFCSAKGWKDFFFIEEEGESGVIDMQHVSSNWNTYYSLDGQLIVGKPTKKGVYIIGNKKMVVR